MELKYSSASRRIILLGVDDGERFAATIHAYGVLLVTVMKKHPSFNLDTIPNLRYTLRSMSAQGDLMNSIGDPICNYPALLRRFAREELGTTDEALEKKILNEWWSKLSSKERKEIEKVDSLADEEEGEDGDDDVEDGDSKTPDEWMKAKEDDELTRDSSCEFALAGVWRTYKDHVAASPRGPLRGPAQWDLRKWSTKDKEPFKVDGGDGGDFFEMTW